MFMSGCKRDTDYSFSIWMPLVEVVGDWALSLCDGSTADPNDFIETDHIRRHYTGSSMYMQRRPGEKFYYFSRQGKNNVMFLKIFDSKKKGIKAPYKSVAPMKRFISNLELLQFVLMPSSNFHILTLMVSLGRA